MHTLSAASAGRFAYMPEIIVRPTIMNQLTREEKQAFLAEVPNGDKIFRLSDLNDEVRMHVPPQSPHVCEQHARGFG